ncbi:amino acid permease/ SLC12A domain-containing protein [Mycena crocata]|nr:amino acid permease/ SLC12A domain-containing protein [Mycena crocata]
MKESSEKHCEYPNEKSDYERAAVDEDAIKIDVKTGLYDGVRREMKQRHIQMIALAGTLGTGLFLGSGKAIAHAGPAGAFLAYMHVGTICYCTMMCLGEMICYMPISGGYIHLAERFLDPALGFSLGWSHWYAGVANLPTEMIGATLIIGFWDSGADGSSMPKSHLAGYLTVLLLLCVVVNFLGVRWFGETEFIFALLKIALALVCIIGGLVIDLGGGPRHDRIGFRYWNATFAPFIEHGNLGKFLGWFQTLLQAAYSYLGMEILAMTAAESAGMLVPYTDPKLLQSTGTAASSPFVLAMTRVGIKGLPTVINAGVLTSAFSAANALLYGTSRQLYGLALRGQAPRIFAKTTKKGLPVTALAFSSMWVVLGYMSLSAGASTALNWLSNLVSIIGFCTWGKLCCIICLTYIRFYQGLEHHGIDRTKFVYWSRLQPFPAYWGLFWSVSIILFNGWSVFLKGKWNTPNFLIAYINIPILILLYGAYKVICKSKIVSVQAMDFYSNVPPPESLDIDEPAPTTSAGKVAAWLF